MEAITWLVMGAAIEPLVSDLALLVAGLGGLGLTTLAIVRDLGTPRP